MSPEQCRGAAIDARSDIFSLGSLLFECLTGAPPFEGDSPMAVLSRHLTQVPDRPSLRRPDGSISGSLESLILRALAKDRAKRSDAALLRLVAGFEQLP